MNVFQKYIGSTNQLFVPFTDIFKILKVANIDFLNILLLSNYYERLCDVVYLSNWIPFRWKLSCPYVTKVTNISGLFSTLANVDMAKNAFRK